jgi:hypothetical protein
MCDRRRWLRAHSIHRRRKRVVVIRAGGPWEPESSKVHSTSTTWESSASQHQTTVSPRKHSLATPSRRAHSYRPRPPPTTTPALSSFSPLCVCHKVRGFVDDQYNTRGACWIHRQVLPPAHSDTEQPDCLLTLSLSASPSAAQRSAARNGHRRSGCKAPGYVTLRLQGPAAPQPHRPLCGCLESFSPASHTFDVETC